MAETVESGASAAEVSGEGSVEGHETDPMGVEPRIGEETQPIEHPRVHEQVERPRRPRRTTRPRWTIWPRMKTQSRQSSCASAISSASTRSARSCALVAAKKPAEAVFVRVARGRSSAGAPGAAAR